MNDLIARRLMSVTLFTLLSFPLHAEDSDTGLHVLRSLVHADRDIPEVCLEADHLLDTSSHARVVTTLQLESDGKSRSLAPQNIVVDANNLCILGLDHRRDYNLTVPFLRGTQGEKLAEAYTLSFTVPDRHATLDFIGNTTGNGLITWHHDDPMLRAMNIDHVHVELYKITDVAALGEAWRQRLQTTLAPSESVYFAKHNGTIVGQEDIDLTTAPNTKIEQPIILSKLQPREDSGLYLLIASAPQEEAKTKKLSLAPLAAIWLLRSNLDLHVVPANNGFYALTEQDNGSAVAHDVRVILQDHNQKLVAETKSDTNGTAFLSYPGKKHDDVETVIGLTAQGDVAFADLASAAPNPYVLSTSEAYLATDKAFYQPEDSIDVTLIDHDMRGQALVLKDSSLRVMRPDQSLFTTIPVPSTEGGLRHVTFAAPPSEGLWSIVWVQSDGAVLAQTPLRLTTNTEAPHFDITADHSMVPDDGALNLTIKGVTYAGSAAPYLAGQVMLTWIVPDKVFPEYSEYSFGVPEHTIEQPLQLASFVTDGKGMAHLHIKLDVPSRKSPAQAAYLTVIGDAATGTLAANPLIIPVRPKDFIVGIKAETQDNHFPENSLAHFSLIALDANGKRRAVNDLSYQISEEGRHFDWYPTQGHWDYKPLRQERRLGGAPLTLAAQDANIIEWPVSAGTYRLDVMDADGVVVVHLPFSAGWGIMPSDRGAAGDLTLTPSKEGMRTEQAMALHFKLPQAAMVTTVIADDRVRQVMHDLKSRGDNVVEIVPQQDWGKRISVSVYAAGVNLGGQILLTSLSGQDAGPMASKIGQSNAADPLILSADIPPLLKHHDDVQIPLSLTNATASAETYHYTFSVSSGLQLTGPGQGVITLLPGQQKEISLTVQATRQGVQSLHMDITGAHGVHSTHAWAIAIEDDLSSLISGQNQSFGPQQIQTFASPDKKQKLEHPSIIVARHIPLSTPEILSAFVHADPSTTRDIAVWLETFDLWHQMIVQTNLLSEEMFTLRQQDAVQQLLARQVSDGGFSAMLQQKSDLAGTIAALYTLQSIGTQPAKLALDQAADWLRRYLENGWFDETERPLRAAAYAALAAVGRVDVASLYYFSDNSKALPPLAAAQLAQAFIAIDDQPKAHYWLQTITPEAKEKNLPLLASLAADPLVDFNDDVALVSFFKGAVTDNATQPIDTMASFLQAVSSMNGRVGPWRILINGLDKTYQGLQVIAALDKPVTLHNMNDTPLMVMQISDMNAKGATSQITRRLYLPNGIDITGHPSFETNGTYIVVLEGAWPKDGNDPVTVTDRPSMALYPASCVLGDATQTDESLAWIKQQPLNRVTLCETLPHGLRVVLDPATRSDGVWRLAYLVKAKWAGHFELSPARMTP